MHGNIIFIIAYSKSLCREFPVDVFKSTENLNRESFAIVKPESKTGCIDFYYDYCFLGESQFTLCGDISDIEQYSTQFSKVLSIAWGSKVKGLNFYPQPDFQGKPYTRYYRAGFTLEANLEKQLKNGEYKSIKIEYN